MPSSPRVTKLLQRLDSEDARSEDELFSAVYEDLREMASRQLSSERASHTLRSTDLVHEGFIKMRRDIKSVGWEWNSRKQFYHIAGRAMRQILVDYARRRSRIKRGGGAEHVSIDEAPLTGELAEGLALYPEPDAADEQIQLDEALSAFEAERPEDSKMFLMSYYAACSQAEIAEAFDVSERTVRRRLNHAKARLAELMGRSPPPPMPDARKPEVDAFLLSLRELSFGAKEDALEHLWRTDPELHGLVEVAMERAEGASPQGTSGVPRSPVQEGGPASEHEAYPRGHRFGKYEVIRLLSSGAQGGVYLARDVTHEAGTAGPEDRLVAVKVALDLSSRRNLRKEAAMLLHLRHNHLPTVEAVGDAGEYFVMEYIRGASLESKLKRAGEGFEWGAVASWMDTVLDVLEKLHSPPPPPQPIVVDPEDPDRTRLGAERPRRRHRSAFIHCDIKPGNLIVDDDGPLYVVDLGVSKSGDTSLTSIGAAGGLTPGYAPPELCADISAPIPQTDLYSLGMTAFELLTGKSLGLYTSDNRRAGGKHDPFDLALKQSGLDRGVAAWIRKATRLDPSERFASATEMRSALQDLRFRRRERVPRWAVAAIAVLALAVLGAIGVATWPEVAPPVSPAGDLDPIAAQEDSLSSQSGGTSGGVEADSPLGADGAADDPTSGPALLSPQTTVPQDQRPPPPTQTLQPRPQPPPLQAQAEPATRRVRLATNAPGVPVLVDGQSSSGSRSLPVGTTQRFTAPTGYAIVIAQVTDTSGATRPVYGRDGGVEVPISESIASIEFMLQETAEVEHRVFDADSDTR